MKRGIIRAEISVRFGPFCFGSIQIDGVPYDHGVVIDRGKIRKRGKKPSKKFREEYGHTPSSAEEEIPWECRRLVIGTGVYCSLPVMKDVRYEAERRKIELMILPTAQDINIPKERDGETDAILRVTC